MRTQPRQFIIFYAFILFACSNDGASLPSHDLRLPSLLQVELPVPDTANVEWNRLPIAVAEDGRLAWVRSSRAESPVFFVLIDSTVSAGGSSGEGPNELRYAYRLEYIPEGLVAIDYDQRRAVVFDLDNNPVRTVRLPRSGVVVDAFADSLDFYVVSGSPSLLRVPLKSQGARRLVPQADSVLRAIGQSWAAFGRDGPPVASTEAATVIGDPIQDLLIFFRNDSDPGYVVRRSEEPRRRTERELNRDRKVWESRLRMRMPDGQEVILPQAEQKLDSLEVEVLPHFYGNGLQVDAKDRLWVFIQVHDSAFADVYQDTLLLGRIFLNCSTVSNSVSLKGEYLAMICPEDAAENSVPELRLFKVID